MRVAPRGSRTFTNGWLHRFLNPTGEDPVIYDNYTFSQTFEQAD